MKFLESPAYEILFGGASGGAKSESLIVYPLRWISEPTFRGIILRRTFPELEKTIVDRSRQIYPIVVPGATYNGQEKVWRFPSGARIYFGHAEHEHSVHQYQGAEFSFIGFDELTHFTQFQYTYMLSRARSPAGLPIRIRSASNPGGDGMDWVMRRWAPWLDRDPAYDGPKAEPCAPLYYLNTEDGEKYVDKGTPEALSRVFIPSKIEDNPHLMKNDPGYRQRLMGLDAVTRAQLLHGDWMAKPGRGAFFKRAWFEVVDAAPVNVTMRTRHWDFAGSVEGFDRNGKPTDPDWTAGVKLSLTEDGIWYVEHVARFRGRPAEVKSTVLSYAQTDGRECRISIPQDPGQAGVAQVEDYTRALNGWIIHALRETGSKIDRAKPVSAQAEARNIRVVRGSWNDAFFDECESFPEGKKDQIDALDGAFSDIIQGGYVTLGEGPVTMGRRRGSRLPRDEEEEDEQQEDSRW